MSQADLFQNSLGFTAEIQFMIGFKPPQMKQRTAQRRFRRVTHSPFTAHCCTANSTAWSVGYLGIAATFVQTLWPCT